MFRIHYDDCRLCGCHGAYFFLQSAAPFAVKNVFEAKQGGHEVPTLWFVALTSSSPVRRRVAETGQGILTNMFEHVDAQRIVRVYEEA